MTSREDAFLILKQWRDEEPKPSIAFLQVISGGPHADRSSMAHGPTVTVSDVSEASGKVWLDEGGRRLEIDSSGASFRYGDDRESALLNGEWVCELEVTWPDGRIVVFAELPPVDTSKPPR